MSCGSLVPGDTRAGHRSETSPGELEPKHIPLDCHLSSTSVRGEPSLNGRHCRRCLKDYFSFPFKCFHRENLGELTHTPWAHGTPPGIAPVVSDEIISNPARSLDDTVLTFYVITDFIHVVSKGYVICHHDKPSSSQPTPLSWYVEAGFNSSQ